MTSYVAGDVRAIQEYVFGSPRLLEMRGASTLVDAFDRGVVPHLAAPERHGGEVGFAGGGNFLVRWEGPNASERAAAFEEEVRAAFLEVTGSGGLTVVRVTRDRPFAEAQREVWRELARAKRRPAGARQLASMPFLKRCESCGREAADTDRVPGAEDDSDRRRWVGPMCERKRRMLGALRRLAKETAASGEPGASEPRLEVFLWDEPVGVQPFSPRLLRQSMPKDFHELTGGDDLAVVVADGNGLGEWFEAAASWEEYRELSERVHESLRGALESALDALPAEDSRLPAQVLVAGGDDLVAALPARYGLRFARELIEGFRPKRGADERGMAAGVLLAPPTFPFRQAHALAGELLARAKHRCRTEGLLAALDFHQVKGTHVQSLGEELARLRPASHPPGRTWSYGGSGPFTPDELEGLLDLAGRLREHASATRRGVLREVLSPRDDGPHTALHGWGVPERVVAELRAWLSRQEEGERPFSLDRPGELVSEARDDLGDGPVRVARLRLADALLLADLGVEARRA